VLALVAAPFYASRDNQKQKAILAMNTLWSRIIVVTRVRVAMQLKSDPRLLGLEGAALDDYIAGLCRQRWFSTDELQTLAQMMNVRHACLVRLSSYPSSLCRCN